ncbi:Exosome complex protein -like protein [Emericellopsis cladophorae]|uniref:Exosome complex protein n=1 Tax=Emericellopsis cladophorae TaxID=2686198 RepID=A0A9P9XW91_9HYPO|nr:Exosome complex protein -like protein [Emericellopsis cladophorae]KAI6778900.1 Exosome complex protein -like protein [Emericellopsis cladophorae]
MADVKDLTPDLARLDRQVDNLEDAMQPLFDNLQEMSSQLPLLDKAKLFSLTAYAIESLLFSSLKLDGADAQNHAVFTELKRIQQYFAKIKAIEDPEAPAQRTHTVNQEAAARILKADLADNKDLSKKLAEKIAEERAKALLKSMEHKKRPAEDSPQASGTESSQGKVKKARKDKSKKKKSKE